MSIYKLSQDYKNISLLLETIVESEDPKEVEEEARRYNELKILEKTNEIKSLELQRRNKSNSH